MGQRPKELTPHRSLRDFWGAELRELRTRSGSSLADLGGQVHCDPSYLGKLERAERPIPAELAEACDRVLEARGALVRLHALVEATGEETSSCGLDTPPGDGHEDSQARTITARTARSSGVDTDEEFVAVGLPDGRVVVVPVSRRVVLSGSAAVVGLAVTPVTPLTAGPSSSSAWRSVAGDLSPVEHFERLFRVLKDNDRLFGSQPVIPVVRAQIGIIQRLRTAARGADQQALTRVEARYTKFCGWLYQDAGDHHLAESCLDRALGLSHLAADQKLTASILGHKAHLAADRGVAADAVGAAEQVLRMAPPGSRLAVSAATVAAYGHALSGERVAMERAYERAHRLLAASDADLDSPYGAWWVTDRWIVVTRARSLTVLGNHQQAVRDFEKAIVDLSGHRFRDRGLYLARAARANAGDRDVERAAALGLEALAIAAETRSGRILTELARLDNALAPWATQPAVADFRAAMADIIPLDSQDGQVFRNGRSGT